MPFRVDDTEQKTIRVDNVALDQMRVDGNVVYKKGVTPSSVKVTSAAISPTDGTAGTISYKSNSFSLSYSGGSVLIQSGGTYNHTITVNITGDGDGTVHVIGNLSGFTVRGSLGDDDEDDEYTTLYTVYGLLSNRRNVPGTQAAFYPFTGYTVVNRDVTLVNGKASFTLPYNLAREGGGSNLVFTGSTVTFTFS